MAETNKYGELDPSGCPNCAKPVKPEWEACPLCGVPLKKTGSVSAQHEAVDETISEQQLAVTCPNCGGHEYLVPRTPGSYKFRCPRTKYVLGIGKYVLIKVKRNGKVLAR